MTDTHSKNRPVLYSFRRCPYAMRARMGLYQSGINVTLREIVLRDKPASMLKASPKGTVPVLILTDGTVIDESLDIMRWALSKNDPDGWLDTDQQQTQQLITHNDGPFKRALDRYKYPSRYPDEDCSGAREACEKTFIELNARLQSHPYLLADRPALADIAIFPFIRQCASVDKDWFAALPLPHLQKWLERHLQSELFQEIMPKFPVWKPEDEPVIFGSQSA